MASGRKLNTAQTVNFTFVLVSPDLKNRNNTVKGTLEWIGEQWYFKTGDYYSALRLEVKNGLK